MGTRIDQLLTEISADTREQMTECLRGLGAERLSPTANFWTFPSGAHFSVYRAGCEGWKLIQADEGTLFMWLVSEG